MAAIMLSFFYLPDLNFTQNHNKFCCFYLNLRKKISKNVHMITNVNITIMKCIK